MRDGATLTIDIPDSAHEADWRDQFVMYFSEQHWPEHLRSSITVTITGAGAVADGLDGGPYTLTDQHDRTYTTPYGCYVSNCGAWWHAKLAAGESNVATWRALPTFKDNVQLETERVAWLQTRVRGSAAL